jgi:hypothetical protein
LGTTKSASLTDDKDIVQRCLAVVATLDSIWALATANKSRNFRCGAEPIARHNRINLDFERLVPDNLTSGVCRRDNCSRDAIGASHRNEPMLPVNMGPATEQFGHQPETTDGEPQVGGEKPRRRFRAGSRRRRGFNDCDCLRKGDELGAYLKIERTVTGNDNTLSWRHAIAT